MLGDYTQGADVVLEIEWGSTGADFLTIQNQGNLAGSVQLSLLDGFLPAAGDSLGFLTAASIFGAFDPEAGLSDPLTGLGFAIRQEINSVYLDVLAAPVPLPPAAWLFGSALAVLFRVRLSPTNREAISYLLFTSSPGFKDMEVYDAVALPLVEGHRGLTIFIGL